MILMDKIMSESYDSSLNIQIIEAAREGNLPRVQDLLSRNANIEAKDAAGDTPLNEAARKGHYDIVVYLLSQGAQLESLNHDNKTALIWARENNYDSIVKYLETYTSNPWLKLDDTTIAHIHGWPKLHHKLTEVFNLATRERLMISENTRTHAEAITPPSSFDSMPEARLQEVVEQAKALGLEVDESFVLSNKKSLPKNKLG